MHWIILYAIGAAQALLLALALWRRPANAAANRVLAAWVALVGVDLAVKATFMADPGPELLRAFRLVALLPFVYCAAFYLYVRTLTTARPLRARDAVHLAGFLAVLAYAGWRTGPGSSWLGVLATPLSGAGGERLVVYDLLLFGWAFGYLGAALARVHRYRRRLRARRSDADRMSLRWIDSMAACQVVIWTIALAHGVGHVPGVGYELIYGAVAAWVFVVGWFSLGQPPVAPEVEADDGAADEGADAQAGDAGDSADDARFDDVQARLQALMEGEELYREPALAIAEVARRSGYPEYLVSAVINRRFGCNFWEYVNRHRVEAVRAHLADPADGRTILDIAWACGFTSKSTFNAAFKRQVGTTPSAYRRRAAGGSG